MLGDPRVQRITGDDTAACYRRTEDADAEARPGDYRGRAVREAYCWSNLTSGNGARALWLLLVPFMVANLAHWMRPAAPPDHKAHRIYDVLVRVLALTLTVLLAAAACEVALDLTAWQCAGTPACVAGRSWMGFLSPAESGWWSAPGRRLVLASAVPLLVIGFLWWLSHRTWSAYESASPPPRTPGTSRDTPADERTALSMHGFWYGRRLVARLRAAHTTTGVLTIAVALRVATAKLDERSGAGTALTAIGQVLTALVVVFVATTLVVVWRTVRSEAVPDDQSDRLVVRALPYASLGALALVAVHAAWERAGAQSYGPLPGAAAFGGIAVLQGVLVLALAVTAWLLQRAARDEQRTALRGMGGPAVALLACAVGGVLSGGVAQRFGDWIDGGATSYRPHGPIVGPPVLLSWQASVLPVLLVVVAVVAVLAAVRVVLVRGQVSGNIAGFYDPRERHDERRTKRIAGTIARAGLTDEAPVLVAATSAVTLVLGTGAVIGAWLTGLAPGRAAEGAPPVVHAAAETAESLGSWLMGAGVILLITMGRRAYRDHSARRTIGILWDVGTFWPRAAHPFAPPCYAERAVPDLTWRIATWTERFDGRVVISGHSQGSVLASAAVWQLDLVTRSRVALLTYGSPLERLYGRWFPAFFGPPALTGLHRETDDWRNLWRFTDPIGGPIRLDGEDGRTIDLGPLCDPLAYGRTLQNPLPAQILGHGDYQADPAFARVRTELIARLGPAVPAQRPETEPAPDSPGPPPPQGSPGRSSA
ncbi:lipase family protein [Streptomyces halobius]|uniref:Lipase family protein n=2 Tax=Streptomyces halobius TaxID=2879846 RepID=A0ABY4MLM2_9ACTN|nr:lipase family protein [Streptomyces halobius]UQA98087.1 lipase family protein [Streptomyces halobius]